MTSKQPKNSINGWINLNKPLGISSAQAVGKVKWLLRPQKIGHAGTLDPLATGILPLALGEATKCVNLLMDAKKIYEFTVTFGERRSTDDAEGEVLATSEVIPTAEQIRSVLPRFMGEITQIPPIYSAIKVDGERAYALARAGEVVEMKSRQVMIHELEFLGFDDLSSLRKQGSTSEIKEIPAFAGMTKKAAFRARVGKGTYIRSLGRDIAQALGTEGYISRLHRARVGPFADVDAISLDFWENLQHKPAILPLTAVLDDIPVLALTAEEHQRLRHGQSVMLRTPIAPAPLIAALYNGQLVALTRSDGQVLVSVRILN